MLGLACYVAEVFSPNHTVFTLGFNQLGNAVFASLEGLFSKSNQRVGVEITPERVNIAQLRQQRQDVKLNTLASIPVPRGVFQAGRIADTAELAELIRTGLKDKQIHAKRAASSIPIQEAVTRLIELPAELDDFELRDIVLNQEAALYLPFPREEADVDFQRLGTSMDEDGIERVAVLIVATPKVVTESYLETFRQAGLRLDVLEVSSFALLRVMREQLLQFAPPEAIAIADIEFEGTEISIVMEGVPQFTRMVPIGTYQIQTALSRKMNMPLAMGSELMQGVIAPHTTPSGLAGASPGSAAIFGILGDLAEELRRSMDFYLNQGDDLEVAQLFLAGPGGGIEQLDEFFMNRLGIPSQPIDPIEILSLELPEEIPLSQRPGLGVAMGLGLREV